MSTSTQIFLFELEDVIREQIALDLDRADGIGSGAEAAQLVRRLRIAPKSIRALFGVARLVMPDSAAMEMSRNIVAALQDGVENPAETIAQAISHRCEFFGLKLTQPSAAGLARALVAVWNCAGAQTT